MPPFDDPEDNKKINRKGVKAAPRRILDDKYIELSTLAMAELETQLKDGDESAKYRSASYILNKVADLFKARDAKVLENKKIKAKLKEIEQKKKYAESLVDKDNSNKKKPVVLEGVPVLNFKDKK